MGSEIAEIDAYLLARSNADNTDPSTVVMNNEVMTIGRP